MRLAILAIAIIGLLAGILTGCQPTQSPGTLVDDLGREVKLEKIPQRIVSHVPSITETLFALGLEDRLVGVSDYCDYPEAAKLKPKVGGYFDPSVEKMVSLNPDIVLTDGFVEYLMPQLDQLGIPYIALQPESIDGILKDIELLGKISGEEQRAANLVQDMRSRIARITSEVAGAPRPKVFYLYEGTDLNNPWTAGPGSFVDALIGMAGGENIAAKAPAAWVQFSIEEIVNSDPALVVFDSKMGTAVTSKEALERHPVWQKIAAVKHGKIYTIDGDLLNRPGPRIAQGLDEMARAIHPEVFR